MGRLQTILLSAITIVFAQLDSVAQTYSVEHYVGLWHRENQLCRGSSDPTVVAASCGARDTYDRQLKNMGWCYGQKGQAGFEMKWHKCTAKSYH